MNSKYLFIGLVLLGVFTACEEFLAEDPKANMSEESFYKDLNDVTLAVNATVDIAINATSIGHRQVSAHAYGDDIMTTNHASNKEEQRQVDQFNVSAGNGQVARTWQKMYEVIYQANAVLVNYQSALATSDEGEVEAMVSIARFYRALHYFELVRGWGDIPLPVTPVVDRKMTRTPVEQVYALIVDDLEEAVKWLPDTQGNNKTYPTVWAAKTLLGDVFLTMAGWPLNKGTEYYSKASVLLKDVMDNSGAELEPEYATLYAYEFDESGNYNKSAEYNSEYIFQIVGIYNTILGGYPTNNGNTYVDALFWKGWNDVVSEIGFMNRFPRDDRFDFTFDIMGGDHPSRNPNNLHEVPWQQFISGHPTFKKLQYNWKVASQHWRDNYRNFDVYRYTDVLLMYAEADAMANNAVSEAAYKAVNDVRERANKSKIDGGTAPSDFHLTGGLSAVAFRDSVLEEAAYEFAGEGSKRWYDLLRTERVEWANAANRKVQEGEYTYVSDRTYKANGSYTNEGYTRVLFDLPPLNGIDKTRYYMPIPAEDIAANPELEQYSPYN